MNIKSHLHLLLGVGCLLTGCNTTDKQNQETQQNNASEEVEHDFRITGSIERIDPGLDELISREALIEVLDSGYTWAEGPLWLPKENKLLFSDVPENTIFEWSEDHGARVYLSPSGYTGDIPRGGEPGSNGLMLDNEGQLVLSQHGDRQMARMNASVDHPEPSFTSLVNSFNGKKLNSPNDGCISADGTLYFTDPPYGLEGNVDDPKKELSFQGVYQVRDGKILLITDQLSRPNGITLSPDGSKLYVSNSDPEKALWMVFPISDGKVGEGKVFRDVTDAVSKENKGLPDGMKTDRYGNLFASGPGGIWVMNPDGKVLGKIHTGEATSNCAFNKDGSVLYLTADDYLMRVRFK